MNGPWTLDAHAGWNLRLTSPCNIIHSLHRISETAEHTYHIHWASWARRRQIENRSVPLHRRSQNTDSGRLLPRYSCLEWPKTLHCFPQMANPTIDRMTISHLITTATSFSFWSCHPPQSTAYLLLSCPFPSPKHLSGRLG